MQQVIIKGVPYYSQFECVRKEWRPRTCTITCLKMAMEDVTGQRMRSIDELYEEALFIQNDMIEKDTTTRKAVESGLLHDVVVRVAHNQGVPAHKEEFDSRFFTPSSNLGGPAFHSDTRPYAPQMYCYGIDRIQKSIRRGGPVIVSAKRDFDPEGTNHSILIVGFEEKSGFYYHDPDSRDNSPRVELFVSMSAFSACWRRLAIFVDEISHQ